MGSVGSARVGECTEGVCGKCRECEGEGSVGSVGRRM